MRNSIFTLLLLAAFAVPVYGEKMDTEWGNAASVQKDADGDYYLYQYVERTDEAVGIMGGGNAEQGSVRAMIKLPKERAACLKDQKISEVSFGVGRHIGSKRWVVVARDLMAETELCRQKFDLEESDKARWKDIVLDMPVEIDGKSDLYIGVEYEWENSESKVIGLDHSSEVDSRDDINAAAIRVGDSGEWENVSFGYNLLAGVKITGGRLPVHDIGIHSADIPPYIYKDVPFSVALVVKNWGSETLTGFTVEYTTPDGTEGTESVEGIEVAPLHLYEYSLDLTDGGEGADHVLSVRVRGDWTDEFTEDDNSEEVVYDVREDGAERVVLLDEMVLGTEADLNEFHSFVEESLAERKMDDRVLWIRHHKEGNLANSEDKTFWFYTERNSLPLFYPAFMVDQTNFSAEGAQRPSGTDGESVATPTPVFQWDGNNGALDYIESRLEEPACIALRYDKLGEEQSEGKTVYRYQLEVSQAADVTIPSLRYVQVLLENGKMTSSGEVWDMIPVCYYGRYADSWGDDLTMTSTQYKADEIEVEVPKGREDDFVLAAYVYTLGDVNSMGVQNAVKVELGGGSAAAEKVGREQLRVICADGGLQVSENVETVRVYDVSGRLVWAGEAADVHSAVLAPALYIVELNGREETSVEKVIVR